MIKDLVTITKNSYKLEDWEKALVEQCIADNPNQSLEYIASLMGISQRTLERMKQKYGVKVDKATRKILAYDLNNN